MKNLALAAFLGSALFALPAVSQVISLECIARGASPPATGTYPHTVQNGDFRVTGNETYPEIGDSVNERTRWTCDFSRQLDMSTIETFEVHAATMKIILKTQGPAWFDTDTVAIGGLLGIEDPTIRSRKAHAITSANINILDHYDSEDIIPVLKENNGKVDLYYRDDSTVVFAELKIDLRPARSENTSPFDGAWDARWNWNKTGWATGITVCLRQDGNKVSGSYTWDDGNEHGTLDEGTLSGDRLDYEFSSPDCSGSGFFLIAQGSPSMTGTYRCAGGPETGVWELTRTGKSCDLQAAPLQGLPKLTSVEIVDPDTLDPIDEIAIGESFRVKLIYAEDPGTEVTESVTIKTSDRVAKQLDVKRDRVVVTGDNRVIVSEPILVVPAVQP